MRNEVYSSRLKQGGGGGNGVVTVSETEFFFVQTGSKVERESRHAFAVVNTSRPVSPVS